MTSYRMLRFTACDITFLFSNGVITGSPKSTLNRNHHHPLTAMLPISRLTVRGTQRVVALAAQRQAPVQTIRRLAARQIQSVAQADRVC